MLLLLQILLAKLLNIMKLDKSPKKVSCISPGIDDVNSSENVKQILSKFNEEETVIVHEDIMLHLKSLNLEDSKDLIKNTGNSLAVEDVNKKETTVLDLIDSELEEEGRGKQYKHILSVDLSRQQISEVEESLGTKLSKLVVLNLSHNKLSSLPDLLDFKCLKELDISHNKFNSVPVCLQISLSKIVNLDISYNEIQKFEKLLCNFTLRKLVINHNEGMRILEWFWITEFPCLEELDLSFTDPFFESLPIWLLNYMVLKKRGVFTNLTSLHIQNTAAFATNISQLQFLKKIKYLNCSNNFYEQGKSIVNVLWEVPPCLLQLRTVQELHLSSIQLNLIPQEIDNLVCLEVLNVSHNKIYRLPESLTNLKRLKELNVSHNYLLELPGNIADLADLKRLHAQHNDLSKLPVGFITLNLVYCDLYSNELDEDCGSIVREMKALQSVDLMQNYINVELLPLDLMQNLRANLKEHERLTEAKVLVESAEVEECESAHSEQSFEQVEKFSGYVSDSPSQSSAPDEQPLPVLNAVSANDSNWDDETTTSEDYNYRLGDSWDCVPKDYEEAIETFRTRERKKTCFIPGDTQIKFFKRKVVRRFNLLSRPEAPGQFDDAE